MIQAEVARPVGPSAPLHAGLRNNDHFGPSGSRMRRSELRLRSPDCPSGCRRLRIANGSIGSLRRYSTMRAIRCSSRTFTVTRATGRSSRSATICWPAAPRPSCNSTRTSRRRSSSICRIWSIEPRAVARERLRAYSSCDFGLSSPICELIRRCVDAAMCSDITQVPRWFVDRLQNLVASDKEIPAVDGTCITAACHNSRMNRFRNKTRRVTAIFCLASLAFAQLVFAANGCFGARTSESASSEPCALERLICFAHCQSEEQTSGAIDLAVADATELPPLAFSSLTGAMRPGLDKAPAAICCGRPRPPPPFSVNLRLLN